MDREVTVRQQIRLGAMDGLEQLSPRPGLGGEAARQRSVLVSGAVAGHDLALTG